MIDSYLANDRGDGQGLVERQLRESAAPDAQESM
jgi:hypothetical protein